MVCELLLVYTNSHTHPHSHNRRRLEGIGRSLRTTVNNDELDKGTTVLNILYHVTIASTLDTP